MSEKDAENKNSSFSLKKNFFTKKAKVEGSHPLQATQVTTLGVSSSSCYLHSLFQVFTVSLSPSFYGIWKEEEGGKKRGFYCLVKKNPPRNVSAKTEEGGGEE